MLSRSLFALLPGALLVLAVAPGAYGQRFNRVEDTRSNVDAYHYHVLPGAATVQVYVMGTVQAPGLYEVGEGTNLGQLLALAGGPTLGPRPRRARRDVTIRLFRPAGYGDRAFYEAALGDAVGHPERHPVLADGDVLTVEIVEKERFDWRDLFTVVGSLSAVGVAVVQILNAAN